MMTSQVINRRSTEGMSFALAAVSLLCSSLWLCYGMMLDNAFIYVPNVLGVFFSASQVNSPAVLMCAVHERRFRVQYGASMKELSNAGGAS